MNIIKIHPDGIHPDVATELLEEIMALQPEDFPSIAQAMKDLDPEEFEILDAVLTALKRKIAHRRTVKHKGMTIMEKRKHSLETEKLLISKGKIFSR